MPTNRTPMRRSRRSSITPEIVAMFVELDRTPARLRRRTHPARTTDQVFLSELTKAQAACAASLGRRQFQGSSS